MKWNSSDDDEQHRWIIFGIQRRVNNKNVPEDGEKLPLLRCTPSISRRLALVVSGCKQRVNMPPLVVIYLQYALSNSCSSQWLLIGSEVTHMKGDNCVMGANEAAHTNPSIHPSIHISIYHLSSHHPSIYVSTIPSFLWPSIISSFIHPFMYLLYIYSSSIYHPIIHPFTYLLSIHSSNHLLSHPSIHHPIIYLSIHHRNIHPSLPIHLFTIHPYFYHPTSIHHPIIHLSLYASSI